METNQSTILDQDFSVKTERRRKLLPWWIKTFSWFFMIAGAFVPLILIVASVTELTTQLALYGIQTNDPASPIGIFLAVVFLLKGFVAYSLWFEKDWAIIAGQIDAVFGLIVCVAVMFPFIEEWGIPKTGFRLEIAFLVLFMFKLIRMKTEWEERG